jgi:hypothetical protein
MKKEIIVVDEKRKVYRVTTPDERFYLTESINKELGLPEFTYKPSVTWITSFYPKGVAFYKWLADKGWNEAEALKVSAGDKGSKVHKGIELLVGGAEVKMEDKLTNKSTGEAEELSVEEYECLMSFVDWYKATEPQILTSERIVESNEYNYAGTVDCIAKIKGETWIIDFKTGQNVWPEYELQLSAYKQALIEMKEDVKDAKLAILQLGYKRNKRLYKFTEVEDKFKLFLGAKDIWQNECGKVSPKQVEYPLSLSLKKKEEENNKPKPKKNELIKKDAVRKDTASQLALDGRDRTDSQGQRV